MYCYLYLKHQRNNNNMLVNERSERTKGESLLSPKSYKSINIARHRQAVTCGSGKPIPSILSRWGFLNEFYQSPLHH